MRLFALFGLWVLVFVRPMVGVGVGAETEAANKPGSDPTLSESRSFYMGFTTFPYAVSFEAVDFTTEAIAQDADLIAYHFDNGVPWVEALADAPYSDQLMDDWEGKRASNPAEHKVLISVTPINFDRTGISKYRGTAEDQPLPAPWDTYTFDHPDVINAFYQYCQTAISFFQPDFFVMGIEVNLLMRNNPSVWDAYITLQRDVYTRLKAEHPDLPIVVTMTGIDLLEGYTDADHTAQVQAFNDIIDYTDIFALSLYPYMTKYMTREVPDEMYDQLATWTDKPMAVSETGYPAQTFSVSFNAGLRLRFNSDENKQDEYITFLLNEAQEHNMRFVINFVLRDYDDLWQTIGGKEDFTIVWRDTGLYAEDGAERPALLTWREWLALPIR